MIVKSRENAKEKFKKKKKKKKTKKKRNREEHKWNERVITHSRERTDGGNILY